MKFSNWSIGTKLVVGAGLMFATSICGIVFAGTTMMYGTAGTEAEARRGLFSGNMASRCPARWAASHRWLAASARRWRVPLPRVQSIVTSLGA
ncbi:hypothetical protein D9M68_830330 [compost metagenome]